MGSTLLSHLAAAGAERITQTFPVFTMLPELIRSGGIVAAEAHAAHRALLAQHAAVMDQRVRQRLELGARQCAADYIDAVRLRAEFTLKFARAIRQFDGLLIPTVPLLAPPIEPLLLDDEAFSRVNGLLLRNTMIANIAAAPALSLPCPSAQTLPVGIMLVMQANEDRRMFSVAAALEQLFNNSVHNL